MASNFSPPSTSTPSPGSIEADQSVKRLPNELLIRILKQATDFSSLHSLINTSSKLSDLFNSNARTAVEAVLSATVPIDIESVMRSVLQIRTQSFFCQNWDEAPTFPLDHRQGFDPISPAISPSILRKFISLAHQIHILTHLCLDRCLERCKSRLGELSEVSSWESASYPEEHRLLLGFWLLQYFFELKMARLKGRLHWTAEDLGDLQHATIDQFWLSTQPTCHQYALTAHEFVAELRKDACGMAPPRPAWSNVASQYCLPTHPLPASRTSDTFRNCQCHLPRLLSSAMGPKREPVSMVTTSPDKLSSTYHNPQPAPLFREAFTAGFGRQILTTPPSTRNASGLDGLGPCDDAVGWGTFTFLCHRGHHMPPTFLKYVDFYTYRQLGLAIWDPKRMSDLGLWMPGTLDKASVCNAWIALLSQSELWRAKENQKQEECDDEW